MAKLSPGFDKFSDEYFKGAPDADSTMIYAEPEKKENRTKEGYTISIKEFIDRYHSETLYMVNALPKQVKHIASHPSILIFKNLLNIVSGVFFHLSASF